MKPVEQWSVTRWVFTGMGTIIAVSMFFFALGSVGLVGGKAVEREVFENSFQYSEARKSAIARYEAQLAEIESQLRTSDPNDPVRNSLQAQAARLRVLLQTERSKQ